MSDYCSSKIVHPSRFPCLSFSDLPPPGRELWLSNRQGRKSRERTILQHAVHTDRSFSVKPQMNAGPPRFFPVIPARESILPCPTEIAFPNHVGHEHHGEHVGRVEMRGPYRIPDRTGNDRAEIAALRSQ